MNIRKLALYKRMMILLIKVNVIFYQLLTYKKKVLD